MLTLGSRLLAQGNSSPLPFTTSPAAKTPNFAMHSATYTKELQELALGWVPVARAARLRH